MTEQNQQTATQQNQEIFSQPSETTPVLTEQQQFSECARPGEPKVTEQTKKTFTRNDIKRHIELAIVFPKIYPDYEPWGFKFRLKLSAQAEERRQEYLSFAAADQTTKQTEQALDEVCDLLVALPTGFGDLQDTGLGPGHSFRSYVETATDTDMKDFLAMVVEAADSAYWGAIQPREFRG